MKHSTIHRVLQAVALSLPAILVAGCPVDLAQLPADQSAAGLYWVEYLDGELSAFQLPEYRGEEGTWLSLETELPEWYTGPALYEVTDDGDWVRLTNDPNLTLDEVMLLHDPPPRP